MLTSLTKGGGGVSQLLTITDKGGGGSRPPPPNMADIFCEQSLMGKQTFVEIFCNTKKIRLRELKRKEKKANIV